MWTGRNRARYDRSKLRYPSDVTDEEWELIVPLIPPGKSGGGKRTVIMREVVNRRHPLVGRAVPTLRQSTPSRFLCGPSANTLAKRFG